MKKDKITRILNAHISDHLDIYPEPKKISLLEQIEEAFYALVIIGGTGYIITIISLEIIK